MSAGLQPPLPLHPPPLQSLKRARRVEFKAGAVILDTAASHTTLVLLMEGLATFKFSNREARWPGWRVAARHPCRQQRCCRLW